MVLFLLLRRYSSLWWNFYYCDTMVVYGGIYYCDTKVVHGNILITTTLYWYMVYVWHWYGIGI